jgi:hypothetical protein
VKSLHLWGYLSFCKSYLMQGEQERPRLQGKHEKGKENRTETER